MSEQSDVNAGLQQQIRERMLDKNLSVAALERKAGLRMSAVRNILRGQSKRPSAENLRAIAKTLECSITDLIGPDPEAAAPPEPKGSSIRFTEPQLLLDSSKIIVEILSSKDHSLTVENVLDLIGQVYLYSAQNQESEIDTRFANWVVDQAI